MAGAESGAGAPGVAGDPPDRALRRRREPLQPGRGVKRSPSGRGTGRRATIVADAVRRRAAAAPAASSTPAARPETSSSRLPEALGGGASSESPITGPEPRSQRVRTRPPGPPHEQQRARLQRARRWSPTTYGGRSAAVGPGQRVVGPASGPRHRGGQRSRPPRRQPMSRVRGCRHPNVGRTGGRAGRRHRRWPRRRARHRGAGWPRPGQRHGGRRPVRRRGRAATSAATREPESDEGHGPAERRPGVGGPDAAARRGPRSPVPSKSQRLPGDRAAGLGEVERPGGQLRCRRSTGRGRPPRGTAAWGGWPRSPTTGAGGAEERATITSSRAVAERPRQSEVMPRRAAPTASTATARMAVASHSSGTKAAPTASSRTASQVAVHRLPRRTARSTSRTISGKQPAQDRRTEAAGGDGPGERGEEGVRRRGPDTYPAMLRELARQDVRRDPASGTAQQQEQTSRRPTWPKASQEGRLSTASEGGAVVDEPTPTSCHDST